MLFLITQLPASSNNFLIPRSFGPRNEEIVGGCRKLCNEKQHGFYSLQTLLRALNSGKKD